MMKMLKRKLKRSFTVVEMMVALILFSVIMFILLSLMTQSQNIMQRGVSKANAFEDAMLVLNRIGDDLACADFSLETSEAYLDTDGDIQFSTLSVQENKCTILTRRYEGTSVLCKVEYKLNDCKLVERVYKFDTGKNDFYNTPASTETLLDNVVALDVIAGAKKHEDLDESGNVDPKDAKAKFDTVEDEHHPFYVTIRLVLMDDETRNIGIKQAEIDSNNYPSPTEIRGRIGAKKFDARLRVLTRTVSLNLNALGSPQGSQE